jgi:hypothetical protein
MRRLTSLATGKQESVQLFPERQVKGSRAEANQRHSPTRNGHCLSRRGGNTSNSRVVLYFNEAIQPASQISTA